MFETGSQQKRVTSLTYGELYHIAKKPQLNTDLHVYFDIVNHILSNSIAKIERREVIRSARVPLIKFDFLVDSERLNCDLSMTTHQTAFDMTKLFWVYAQLDERVPLLLFLVRYWASLLDLTNSRRPSPNFTNFQLTMLALSFALRIEHPLILPLEEVLEDVPNTIGQTNVNKFIFLIK